MARAKAKRRSVERRDIRVLTREEQQTVILGSAADTTWNFFTLDPKFVRRLTKLGYRLEKDPQGGWSCDLPLNRVTIRKAELARRKASALSLEALAKSRASLRGPDSDQGNPSHNPAGMV